MDSEPVLSMQELDDEMRQAESAQERNLKTERKELG